MQRGTGDAVPAGQRCEVVAERGDTPDRALHAEPVLGLAKHLALAPRSTRIDG